MQVYEEITPAEMESQERAEMVRQRTKQSVSVLLVQAVLCILILAAAMMLRACLPASYAALRERYESEMARSVLISDADLSYS